MRAKTIASNTILFTLAILWLLIAVIPFFFMIQTGFKKQFELLTSSVWSLPQKPTLDNYVAVLSNEIFLKYFLNSILVVGTSVFLILIISSMASYVFARIRFRLNRPLFSLIIAGLVIPVHITLVPIYLLTINLKLYDSILALIGPYVAFNIPLSIFILTEFMRQIPRELEDAARIDGCSPMRIFYNIILPLSSPGLATLAIYNAVFLWNEFVFAFVLISSPKNRTLPLAIWDYQGQYSANIPAIMAVLTLSSLPLIAVYIVGQERVVKGILAGALRG
jgi:raffinose/stachyose/melibiose transport system permease protein